jgi:hypothetical protein
MSTETLSNVVLDDNDSSSSLGVGSKKMLKTLPAGSLVSQNTLDNTTRTTAQPPKSCMFRQSRIAVSDLSDDEISDMSNSLDQGSFHRNNPQHLLYIEWAERQQKKQKRVTFSTVQIRHYPIILCDHPFCSAGPPVGLGWEYEVMPEMDLKRYDRLRKGERRTNMKQLILSPTQRNELMDRIGVSLNDRRVAEREVKKIQRNRAMEGIWIHMTAPFETVVGSARRMQRAFKRQNARLLVRVNHDDGSSCSTSSSQSLIGTTPKKNKRSVLRRQSAF